MEYYKVTYNSPQNKYYTIIVNSQFAESKWHAIELVFSKQEIDFPERKYYKAKLLK